MKKTTILLIAIALIASAVFVVAGCSRIAELLGATLTINNLKITTSAGTEIASGEATTSRTVTLSGNFEDLSVSTFTLTVNGTSSYVPVTSGSFSQTINLINGVNTIKLSAFSISGGSVTKYWTVNCTASGSYNGAQGIWVQLTWDSASNMDLHFNKSTGGLIDSTDCYYYVKAPDWNGNGITNTPGSDTITEPAEPVLDFDDQDGYGPENTFLKSPPNGTYWVRVRAFNGSARPTLRVYFNGTLQKTYQPSSNISGSSRGSKDVWRVCEITWSNGSGSLTDINTIGSN